MDHREEHIARQIDEIIQSAVKAQGGPKLITPELRPVLEAAVVQRLKIDTSGGKLLIPMDDIVVALEEILDLLQNTRGTA